MLQCGLLYYRQQSHDDREGIKHAVDGRLVQDVMQGLPFELTAAQQRLTVLRQQSGEDIEVPMEEQQ